jgi:hypothetical protein
MRLKHPMGSTVEVTEAQASRLMASGRGWVVLDGDESPENAPVAASEPAEGEDTEEAVTEPQEPTQSQEEPVKDKTPASREDMRAWARENRPDLNVKENGKLPLAAIQAYQAAHN